MSKFETHMHTSETSSCGKVEAAEGIRLYKKAGYDGVVITDHFYEKFFEDLAGMPWEDKIDNYLAGYRKAYEEGKRLGITVLLGMEIRFTENANDYLVYGVSESFLKNHPKPYKLGLKEFKKLADRENFLIFQAHPYRAKMIVADLQDIHGVEVYNGNPRHNSRNDKALTLAAGNGLLMSSGSDFHQPEDVARGGMIFPSDIKTIGEFVQALKRRAAELIRTE